MKVNPFGIVFVLFGLCNLAITRWVLKRRHAGRPLPGVLRGWEIIGRVPRLAVALACCEIVLGGMIAAKVVPF